MSASVLQFRPMPTPKRDNLPNRIRHWRELQGLTLRDLAPRVGLAHGSLARIETGAQELGQYWLVRIAAELKVAPADLLPAAQGGLSEDERRLIDTYREVPEANRRVIESVIESQQGYRGGPETHELFPRSA